jgi:hypothetical protein
MSVPSIWLYPLLMGSNCSLPLLGWFARSWQRLQLILGMAAAVSFTGDHLHV